ncbi:MAG: hypothetical protein GY701_28800 [Sulfitobacter sp.]|nr:hypothetical protein [Sulfitobacter sp.]
MKSYPIQVNQKLTVTGATNATPIVITTSANHDMATGEEVDIEGILDNTNANGTWTITKISATTFSLDGSAGNASYVNGQGTVQTRDALARTFVAGTAFTGHVHRFPDAKQDDKFNFIVDASADPTGGGSDDVDLKVFGRPDDESDWIEIIQISETDSWDVGTGGRYMSAKYDQTMFPQLRIDVIVSASSTTVVKAWIAL